MISYSIKMCSCNWFAIDCRNDLLLLFKEVYSTENLRLVQYKFLCWLYLQQQLGKGWLHVLRYVPCTDYQLLCWWFVVFGPIIICRLFAHSTRYQSDLTPVEQLYQTVISTYLCTVPYHNFQSTADLYLLMINQI